MRRSAVQEQENDPLRSRRKMRHTVCTAAEHSLRTQQAAKSDQAKSRAHPLKHLATVERGRHGWKVMVNHTQLVSQGTASHSTPAATAHTAPTASFPARQVCGETPAPVSLRCFPVRGRRDYDTPAALEPCRSQPH